MLRLLGLPWDGELPHAKIGIRRPDDRAQSLTLEQIERIGRVFLRSSYSATALQCQSVHQEKSA